jgi:tetratricopeptide (TPR) repeat protein
MIRSAVRAAAGVVAMVTMTGLLAGPESLDIRRAKRHYENGARALQAGNVNKARRSFTKAVQILPSFPEAHLGMGHIALQEQRFEDALREYQTALEGYRQLGDLLYDLRARRYSEAQTRLINLRNELTRIQNPSFAKLSPTSRQMRTARLELEIRRLETIRPPIKGASTEPPGEVHFHLGNALFRLERLGEAIESWETCARLLPDFPVALNNLAVAYWKQGQIEKARSCLEEAERRGLAVNPQFKAELNRAGPLEATEGESPPGEH